MIQVAYRKMIRSPKANDLRPISTALMTAEEALRVLKTELEDRDTKISTSKPRTIYIKKRYRALGVAQCEEIRVFSGPEQEMKPLLELVKRHMFARA